MFNRRALLRSASATAIAGMTASRLAFAAAAGIIPGLQLFTVRAETGKDLEGTLRAVANAGYREIEYAGYYGRTASELNKLMQGLGMSSVSTHVSASDIASRPGEILAMAQALGLEFIICSSPMVAAADKELLPYAEKMQALDLADWQANAELFNRFGRQAQAAGIQLGYHNHHVEFRRFDGVMAYDKLLEWTDPGLVTMQLDVAWAVAARVEPVGLLEKYPGRFSSLHVKDLAAVPPQGQTELARTVEVGAGIVDWETVIAAARKAGVSHFFVEQEPPFARPVLESIVISADYLKALQV
jgi:sugar phosphate isomerase/epimerase